MTPTLRRKLEALAERREELERLLADPDVIGDGDRFRAFCHGELRIEFRGAPLDALRRGRVLPIRATEGLLRHWVEALPDQKLKLFLGNLAADGERATAESSDG